MLATTAQRPSLRRSVTTDSSQPGHCVGKVRRSIMASPPLQRRCNRTATEPVTPRITCLFGYLRHTVSKCKQNVRRLSSNRAAVKPHKETMMKLTTVIAMTGMAMALLTAPALAQDVRPDDVKQDRKDIRQDRRDLRGDRRDIQQDRRDIRQDTKDIRGDRRDLREDRRELAADRKAGNKDAVKNDLKDIREDRKDLKSDVKDRRADAKDLRKDRRDRRQDRRDLHNDRKDLKADKAAKQPRVRARGHAGRPPAAGAVGPRNASGIL